MTKYLILFFVSFTSVYATEVSTATRGPFSCEEAARLAHDQLVFQCQQLHQTLQDFQIGNCVPDGGDGGYVDYYLVDAHGVCH